MRSLRTNLLIYTGLTVACGGAHLLFSKPANARHVTQGEGTSKGPLSTSVRASRHVPHQISSKSAPEEIKVHAVKLPFGRQSRQKVGVSETHIDAKTLAEHQVVDVKGLMNLAPNLTVQPQGASSNVNFTLRGVGFKDFTSNNTPSVMTYIDGVAMPIGFMAGGALFDLSGVDVTPGPVGFSHGQTVTAGEVNIATNNPTKTFHYGGSEDLASYARSITTLYVSGPITDNLQYRISGFTQHGGGYQTNMYNGHSLGNANKGAIRGKLAWQPDEKTNIVLTGHWMQDNSEGTGVFNVQDTIEPLLPPAQNNLRTGWGFSKRFTDLIGVRSGTKPFLNNTFWGFNLNMTRDLGWANLTSISSYEQMYVHNLLDLDGANVSTYDYYNNNNSNVFSQEVRLSNRLPSDRLQWVTGMYYDRTRAKVAMYNDFSDSTSAAGVALRPYISDTSYHQNQQAFSQFARLRFGVTSRLHIIAGISHESDDRQMIGMNTKHYAFGKYATAYTNSITFPNSGALANQFSGMGGVEFQALSNLMLYGNIRKSFKPGGFTGNNTVIAEQLTPTKPETLLAYEVGFKSDYFHHRLRVNGDAFWYNYHGQQILGEDLVSNYGLVGQYINVPKTDIWGIELSVDANPIRGLTLHQHIGYERGVYKDLKFLDIAAVTSHFAKTGSYVPYYNSYDNVDSGIPKLTLDGSAEYKFNLSKEWTLAPNISYSYRGSQLDVPGNPVYRLPAYFLMNLGMTFAPMNNRWSLSVYSSNVLDRHYDLTRDIGFNAVYGVPGTPRFVGGRFRVDM